MEEAVTLIDEVLKSFGGIGLFENPDFIINKELQLDNYLQFEAKRNTTHAKFVLIISGGDIRIDIDRAEEAFEWSAEQVRKDRDEIVSFIKMVFTSTIKIEYCGSRYTKLYFIDENRKCVKTLRYVTGLFLKIGCKTKEHPSIYERR